MKNSPATPTPCSAVDHGQEADPPPTSQWFWQLVTMLTVGLIAHTAVGLVLAMAGRYSTWIVLPVTIALTVSSWPWIRRAAPRSLDVGRVQPILMIIIAIGILGYSATHIGQAVFTKRDPGSYLTTGRWLADHGSLEADVSNPVFDAAPEVSYGGPAVYDLDDGNIEFQFSHGSSISMATAFDLAGPHGLFLSSAVIGSLALLAVYLALNAVTRSPWLAVAGTTGLGVSLPFIYATRNTYSEPFVLLLIALALAVLLPDGRCLRRSQLALVGLLLGSAMLFRVDAQLYLAGLLAIGTLLILWGTRLSDVAIMLGVALVPFTIGTIDVRFYAGDYAADLSRSLTQLDRMTMAMTVLLVVTALVFRSSGWKWFQRAGNQRVASWIGAAVAIAGILAWQVRPTMLPATSRPRSLIDGLQRKYGMPEDPTRTYAELSVDSISWYLGALVVALAILGFSLMAWRLFSERRSRFWPAALLITVGVPLYLIDPKITPDQLWATRRFLPMILPAFLVAATWGADRIIFTMMSTRAARNASISAMCVGLALPAFATSWPIRAINEQRGEFGAVEALCDALGDQAAVIDLENGLYSMAVRSWCGASAANISLENAETIALVLAASRESCVPTYFLGANENRLTQLAPEISNIELYSVSNPVRSERTLDEAPSTYRNENLGWALGRVTLPATCA